MISSNLTIINKLGLHARAAAKLAATANHFSCQCELVAQGKSVNCKSIMALMLLAAAKGTKVQLHCNGADENAALETIVTLINNRFDEAE